MNTKTVTVFSQSLTSGRELIATRFIYLLKAALAQVPEEHRAAANVTFCSTGDYDGEIELTYERPETEAERIETAKIERLRTLREEQRELSELTRLQKKYGKL